MGMHFQTFHPAPTTTTREGRASVGIAQGLEQDFHFWRGASGRRYVHTVYSLIGCPELPEANYVMVRRRADGSREALRIARSEDEAPSLNLAAIRQRAAQLGAHEIHVHLLADSRAERALVERDLQAGQFAELAAEPTSRPNATLMI